MIETAEFSLPGGALDAAGECHRGGQLRPLTGGDEDWLHGLAPSTRQAGLVTDLLARCVVQLGPLPITADLMRDLSVGDRDYLLLKLREVTFGAALSRVLACPKPACDARMDLDLAISDFPVHERPSRASHRVQLDGHVDRMAFDVEFRVPRGREQELIAAQPTGSPDALRERLLASCVVRAVCADTGAESSFAALSPAGRRALAEAIEEAAPRIDLEVELVCPECGAPFDVAFDAAALLLDDLGASRAALERELHLLALHYHWSLGELLGLTRPRRQRFLRLLADDLGARTGSS